MDKIKIGRIIREHRGSMIQSAFTDLLRTKGVGELDVSRLSRVENGKENSEELYARICEALGVALPEVDTRLLVAFSQGFWAAPLVWINEHSATPEFFQHIALSSYFDPATKEPIFSTKEAGLAGFDPEAHAYYYSGEITDLLHEGKIDVGFLGSTVVDEDRDLVRIARLVNADSVRHAMLVVAPKGRFKSEREAIESLLVSPAVSGERFHIYYPAKSTAEKEFRDLLQFAGHYHNTIPVLHLPALRIAFEEKLRRHEGQSVALIALMLSIEAAKAAVRRQDPLGERCDVFTFRTSEIVRVALEKGIQDVRPRDFYYEMVVRRNNEKIRKLAFENRGFQLLLKELKRSVENFAHARTEPGIPLSHHRVAGFFGLDTDRVSQMLKLTAFELSYYPEWVNKVLEI